MSLPLVSIYIVTWNRLALLKRALTSALNQSYHNTEIIVSDNGSSDGTAEYIRAMQQKHPNIRYLQHPTNLGACFARNAAIKTCQGQYITGLDDDDEMLSNRIESLMAAYKPHYAFAFADDLYQKNGRLTKGGKRKKHPSLNDLLFRNCVGNQVFSEKYKFIDAGLFDTQLTAAQDYDMWLRMIRLFGPATKANKRSQIIHLDHEQRISTNNWGKFSGYLHFYRKHKALMSNRHRAHQLLMTKSLCRIKIHPQMYWRLFSPHCLRAKAGILWRNIIKPRMGEHHG